LLHVHLLPPRQPLAAAAAAAKAQWLQLRPQRPLPWPPPLPARLHPRWLPRSLRRLQSLHLHLLPRRQPLGAAAAAKAQRLQLRPQRPLPWPPPLPARLHPRWPRRLRRLLVLHLHLLPPRQPLAAGAAAALA